MDAMPSRCSDYVAGLLAAIDPVAFHRRYLTGVLPGLDDWQVAALRDPSPNKLLLCGRQTGKSTLAALMAAHRSIMLPSRLVLLLSPTLRQSTELFRKTVTLVEAVDGKPEYVQKTSTQLTLANQSKIVSLPGANPDAIRGYSEPDLIIEDEAAFVGDRTFTATRPMLAASVHPTHVLMSTPYGRRGHFHQRWQAADPDWSKHTIRSEDCPRITKAFLEGERRVLSERAYRQEYCCEFLEAATAVFPSDLIERLVDDNRRRDVLPDAELSSRIRNAKTAAETTELMRQTGMLRDDGSVSLDKIQGPAGPLAALNDEPRNETYDPEARAEFYRLNKELAELRDGRRAVSDRAAKVEALDRRIEALRERARFNAVGVDRQVELESRSEDSEVEANLTAWGQL